MSLVKMYTEYKWGDLWSEAKLGEVIKYVRASKKLRMPDCWREVFPTRFPEDDDSDGEYNY